MTYQPKDDRFPQLSRKARKEWRHWVFERSDHAWIEPETALVYITPYLAVPATWPKSGARCGGDGPRVSANRSLPPPD